MLFDGDVNPEGLALAYNDGGNADAQGGVFKAAYAPARNWTLNLTYFLNKTNLAAPVAVTGACSVYNRKYRRLQLDANVKF